MKTNYDNVILTYLANSEKPLKHALQIAGHVFGNLTIQPQDKGYGDIYFSLQEMQKAGKVDSFLCPTCGHVLWYHAARFNPPFVPQGNAS